MTFFWHLDFPFSEFVEYFNSKYIYIYIKQGNTFHLTLTNTDRQTENEFRNECLRQFIYLNIKRLKFKAIIDTALMRIKCFLILFLILRPQMLQEGPSLKI